MLRKFSTVSGLVLFALILTGCLSEEVNNAPDIEKQKLTSREEATLIMNARKFLVNLQSAKLIQEEKRKALEKNKDRIDGADEFNAPSVMRLTAAERRLVMRKLPEVSINYRGYKEGRASITWPVEEEKMIRKTPYKFEVKRITAIVEGDLRPGGKKLWSIKVMNMTPAIFMD